MSDRSSNSKAPKKASDTPRPVESGDTLEVLTQVEAEHVAIDRGTLRSQIGNGLTLGGVIDSYASGEPSGEVIANLRVLMDGAAPDERKALKKLLWAPADGELEDDHAADRELSAHWRDGRYPYKNLMSRKAYERQKYFLQVELLKLQMWVKESGQRVVILFEGRDAAGKGGRLSG